VLPVWLDGALLDPGDATVPVFDHGITVGDGVFETLRTAPEPGADRWVPFAVTRHLRRLRRSLDGLGLHLDRTDDELGAALHAVAEHIEGPGRVRLTVTGGPGPLGSARSGEPLTVFVAGSAIDGWPETGAAVTVPWVRNERSAVAGLKTTSYAENVVALAHAQERGASEAIFANTAGRLCEGTGSNVFVVLAGRLSTPPLSSGCLAGVTRELVCELADVAEDDLPLSVLAEADEVFLTSSTRDVQGQHRVDDRRLDAPGPVTRAVAQAFADLVATDIDP
jgi:branched-chain amino acid aminotransferase